MELRHLRYFQAVAEAEHMTRAAEALHMSQPALTRQIKQLEEELGVPLFERLPRGIRLNACGQRFLSDVEELFSKLQAAVLRVQRTGRGEQGRLRIGFVDPAAWAGEFPKLLQKYRTSYPDVELSVQSMWSVAQLEAIDKGGLDAGICYGFESLPESCEAQALRNDKVMLAAPKHFGWRGRRMSCADLAGEPFVRLENRLAPKYVTLLERTCEEAELQLNTVQTAPDENALLCLVSAGVGLGLVNSAHRYRRPVNVDFIELVDFQLGLPLQLVWRSDSSSPTLRRFLELL